MTNLRPGHGERMLRRAVEKAKHRPESAMFRMPVVRLDLSQAEHLLREIEALREMMAKQRELLSNTEQFEIDATEVNDD